MHTRCCVAAAAAALRERRNAGPYPFMAHARMLAAAAATAAAPLLVRALHVLPATPLQLHVRPGAAANNTCPAGTPVACGSSGTCCSVLYSGPGYGCCPGIANAVCCGLQSCCPPGFTCLNTPPYESVCVNATGA